MFTSIAFPQQKRRNSKVYLGEVDAPLPAIDHIGEADVLFEAPGADVLMLVTGPLAGAAVAAARQLEPDGIGVRVADPGWVLPVSASLSAAVRDHRLTVTVEDGGVSGGFGANTPQYCTHTHQANHITAHHITKTQKRM